MLPRWFSLLRPAVLTMAAALILSLSAVREVRGQSYGSMGAGYGQSEPNALRANAASGSQASRNQASNTGMGNSNVLTGKGPPTFEVVCPAICYGGAFRVFGCRVYPGAGYYGPFRRYWGYAFYGPNVNEGPGGERDGLHGGVMYVASRLCHGLSKHGGEDCSADGFGGLAPGDGMNPPAAPAAPTAPTAPTAPGGRPSRSSPEKLPPPTPNTAHLQLLVPEKAEVRVEGVKTSKTGTVRDFVSPPLTPGMNMTYMIVVRYTDGGGKTVEETHSIRVRANDRLLIDCTKPASAEPTHATVQRP